MTQNKNGMIVISTDVLEYVILIVDFLCPNLDDINLTIKVNGLLNTVIRMDDEEQKYLWRSVINMVACYRERLEDEIISGYQEEQEKC